MEHMCFGGVIPDEFVCEEWQRASSVSVVHLGVARFKAVDHVVEVVKNALDGFGFVCFCSDVDPTHEISDADVSVV